MTGMDQVVTGAGSPAPVAVPGICVEQVVRRPSQDDAVPAALPSDLTGFVERLR